MQSPWLSQSPLQPYYSLSGSQQSSQQNFTKIDPCPLNTLMEQAVVNQNRTVVTEDSEDREGLVEDIGISLNTWQRESDSEDGDANKGDVVFYTVFTLTVEELDMVSIFSLVYSLSDAHLKQSRDLFQQEEGR